LHCCAGLLQIGSYQKTISSLQQQRKVQQRQILVSTAEACKAGAAAPILPMVDIEAPALHKMSAFWQDSIEWP
jgi:sensor histidine kinase regulating citrate/malate metabolism